MDDVDLLKALKNAHLEGQERPGREGWEALTEGRADDAQRAALEREAADDPAGQRALALHEPLDSAARERILAAIVAAAEEADADGATDGVDGPTTEAVDVADEAPLSTPADRELAEVIRPRSWQRMLRTIVPMVAAAAALVFVIQRRGDGGGDLPEYQLQWSSAVRERRGAETGSMGEVEPGAARRAAPKAPGRAGRPAPSPAPGATGGAAAGATGGGVADAPEGSIVLHSRARFKLVARPAVAVATKLSVRAAIGQAAEFRPWPVQIDISPSGAIRLSGSVAKLFPAGPGKYSVALVIRADGEALSDEDLIVSAGGATTPAHTIALRSAVEIVD